MDAGALTWRALTWLFLIPLFATAWQSVNSSSAGHVALTGQYKGMPWALVLCHWPGASLHKHNLGHQRLRCYLIALLTGCCCVRTLVGIIPLELPCFSTMHIPYGGIGTTRRNSTSAENTSSPNRCYFYLPGSEQDSIC